MLNIKDNMITAAKNLKKSVSMMVKYRMAPYPLNYTLCYAYVSDYSPAYCVEMKQTLDKHGGCPRDVAQQLYHRYFQPESALPGSGPIQDAISSETDRIIDEAMEINQDIDSFDEILGEVMSDVDGLVGIKSVHPALVILCEQTEIFKKQMKAHQLCVLAANKKIKSLKEKLDDAQENIMKDDLTSLFNRRMFDATLSNMVFSEKQPTSMAIFDIDNFKTINDLYGHLMGDAVIKKVAEVVSKTATPGSICVRLGGDEFAIIFQGLSLQEAEGVSEKIRLNTRKLYVKTKEGKPKTLAISLSIGVTQLRNTDTKEDLIGRADNLMYMAKDSGKNLVVMG